MTQVDHAIWQRIIQHVVDRGGNLIRPWFTELEPLSLEHGLLEIQVPGPEQRSYCQQHATRLFTEAAQKATGRLIGVCFLCNGLPPMPAPSSRYESHSAGHDGNNGQHRQRPAIQTPSGQHQTGQDDDQAGGTFGGDDDLRFNGEYTFKTFVNGPCNRLAHAACMAISETPGLTYNPLFIHGSVGLGKTHLIHATCQKVKADRESARTLFLSCETFVNHFIQAVERGLLHEFRYRYRHVDVLAIDDIQFLADHEQTQEEFFHTFNTLYQDQKQIILTSDRGPAEIKNLEERLTSRFNWGLVARIDKPCYETRVAIVHKKARLRNIDLPDEVACFIAAKIDSNIRELEGAISKITMLAQVLDHPLNLALAEQAFGGGPAEASRREVTIEDILKAVTSRFNVRIADLQSKKRSRSIAFPRQVCMYLAREMTRHSLEEIGGYFGGRDHSTVLHANKQIESLRDKDAQFQATLDSLSHEIQAASV
ncbi:MAG: chromosomal replication initiator protein DnaA [Planctomycetota bacterium]